MIFITGGLGFIGSHTTKAVLDKGIEVVTTQYRSSNVPSFLKDAVDNGQLHIERADVTDPKSLDALGKRYDITDIIHLAAPKIGALEIVDDLQANMQGLLDIIRAGRAWKVRRIVVASSMGVYGATPNPLREDALLSMTGNNPIGASKKMFEVIGDTVAAQSPDMNIVFVRPSAIWGPLGRQPSPFFSLPQMVHAAAKGSSPEQLGQLFADDGIDMCYVKDCGRAIALLATAPQVPHRTYNIGSGRAATNAEIASVIQDVVPSASFTLLDGHGPHAPAENMYMDITRLQDMGFTPKYDIKQGIADYIAWLRAGNTQ